MQWKFVGGFLILLSVIIFSCKKEVVYDRKKKNQ